jgi:hypothetical protein
MMARRNPAGLFCWAGRPEKASPDWQEVIFTESSEHPNIHMSLRGLMVE